MEKLQLKDLFIGNTDAKNELIESSGQEVDAFVNGFLIPDNVILGDFFSGKKFFITGLKGTGKTALLRYIGINLEKKSNSNTAFILFKSDIREEERSNIIRNAEIIGRNDAEFAQYKDYEKAWILFLFQRIVKICCERKLDVFTDDINWRNFTKLVQATQTNKKDVLFPKLKGGRISLNLSVLNTDVEFEANQKSDFIKENNAKVDFISVVSECEDLFSRLIPGPERLYIFIDELELSLGTNKQYRRDVELIRDFILSINRVNEVSRKNQLPLFCIAGVRKEVLAVTQSAGKEINKPVSDFGVSLRWQQVGGDMLEHPLIKIIIKRLLYAERALPLLYRSDEKTIWKKYFPDSINRNTAKEYILNKTWYRPRDIIRILNIAQQQFPKEEMFSQSVFESINKDYSIESWTEQVEELQAKYSKEEINGIKHILMGLSCPFSLNTISEKAMSNRLLYSDVDSLLGKYRIADILDNLYDLGVIGNTGKNSMRYSFRGDDGLLLDKNMTIHPALWNVLSITSSSTNKRAGERTKR